MNTAKVAIACGIATCFDVAYTHEGIAGVAFLLLTLFTLEAIRRMKRT
jgi:hypothetical protein